MQRELTAEGLPVEVRILGVNGVGQESGNTTICEGRDLPWLQDVAASETVWTMWRVLYRDVVILDTANEPVATYNLTEHNLGQDADYAELKGLLRALVTGGPAP